MVAGRLQEKNGYFYVVLSYKDNNGLRKQPWFRTGLKIRGNKKQAEEILMYYRLHFDIQTGKLNGSKYGNPKKHIDMLFGDYLLVWLEEIKMTVEATTYAGYKNNIQGIIAPYFNKNNIRLRTLNAYMIEEFYRKELNRISANTILRYHANIRKALSDAVKDGLITENPARKVHKPKTNQHIASYYTKEELKILFKVVKGSKIEFPVLMASCHGLRREEIVGLQWSAIDFENKTITIRHTIVQCMVDNSYQILKRDWGKTKKSIRTLPLIPLIEELLIKMRKREAEDRIFLELTIVLIMKIIFIKKRMEK